MRLLILALAVAFPSVAAAGDLWPTFDSGWQYVLKEPAGPGRERYGIVGGEPGRSARWTLRVECGVRDTRTGRVLQRVVGTGEGTRGRSPGFGGQFDLPDGRCGTFIVTQDAKAPEKLSLHGDFDEGVPECPRRGVGDLSSGD